MVVYTQVMLAGKSMQLIESTGKVGKNMVQTCMYCTKHVWHVTSSLNEDNDNQEDPMTGY